MAQGKTQAVSKEYKTVIGLEVHVQLATKSKCFCGCSTEFGRKPNSQVCPVCLGFPGSLPVLNEEALRLAIKAALALNCQISKFIKFDRKNYFYPDLPKNFQISQYDLPVSHDGWLMISGPGGEKKIRIKRAHLEEDAGKLIHEQGGSRSFVDFNRTGTPLLEIVSEPDINSADEAYEYLTRLKGILEYLEVSDCNMEQGSLRCDANISVMPAGAKELGEKVELKNMNSFRFVKIALEYEAKRQIEALEGKEKVVQETRLWHEQKGITISMRSKEHAHDYRYFPEPDLVPFVLDDGYIQKIGESLPELSQEKKERFVEEYNIPEYDAGVLTADKYLANYFEECAKLYSKPKTISNWIMSELLAYIREKNLEVRYLKLKPRSFVEIFRLMDEGVISGKVAKQILPEMLESEKQARDIVKEKGLVQISDTSEIDKMAQEVIRDNPKPAADYRAGQANALSFLVGQIMKKSRGKANPQIVNKLLKQKLERGEDA
ncbi:MAG: Asp-tRNA(Asn)/Glu-tRNA(Gln) amidotransferase subunit GatB [Candidatus Omnitrophica bacterium]|nr:Asp-tRNA(Asn)/Glu-tRNA(Gln) amidotransferase subunit GatB [Candidatus Omnitrophota bacterium]